MSLIGLVLVWALIVIVSMAVSVLLAHRWGRDPFGWAVLAAGMGPFAIVALLGTHKSDVAHPQPFQDGEPPQTAGLATKIVVAAVDASDAGAHVARYICEHVPAARVELLTILPREWHPTEGTMSSDDRQARVDAATRRPLDLLREAGVPAAVVVGYGEPGAEVVRFAETCSAVLVVVGRRGAGLTKALLGSVSDSVVKHARCPVVVVG
ncbi:MAG: universal stress protein [Chloroflexota bacterium]